MQIKKIKKMVWWQGGVGGGGGRRGGVGVIVDSSWCLDKNAVKEEEDKQKYILNVCDDALLQFLIKAGFVWQWDAWRQ